MSASLLKAAKACNIRCCQRDNQGRFNPFHFEPMEHTLALHTVLAEPFGVVTSSAPRTTTYTLGPDGRWVPQAVAANPFGAGASVFDPETMALTALCGGCASPHDLKACSKCKRTRFCSKECLTASWALHKKECKKIEAAGARG